ncbi:polysialyltransferase family glycosyltransferase [Neorhizobium sp. NCHU2750]|uniref:polysialyltransferase family glycosyltransferase n=1 Tax=Neorhizobium sp. NCHU2750 TaxID=1825976 RepID=UPI000E75D043|nr:hypothetical protein NCHU2750_02830 [Neorhizobium sp. NCHU2750]
MEIEAKNSIVIARTEQNLRWVASIDDSYAVYVYNLGSAISDDVALDRIDHIIEVSEPLGPSAVFLRHILTQVADDGMISVFVDANAQANMAPLADWLAHCTAWSDPDAEPTEDRDMAAIVPELAVSAGKKLLRPDLLASGIPALFRSVGLDQLAASASGGGVGSYRQYPVVALRNSAIKAMGGDIWNQLYRIVSGDDAQDMLLSHVWPHLFGAPFEKASREIQQGSPVYAMRETKPAPLADVSNNQALQQDMMSELTAEVSRLSATIDTQRQAMSQLVEIVSTVVAAAVAPRRRQRLFISTGYFATAVAATVLQQLDDDYDNHLLIVLDRQDPLINRRWAYQMFSNWASVRTATHVEYYVNKAEFQNPFGIDFNEVYSPDITVINFVRAKFKAERYHFFEEGLSTYDHIKRLTVDWPDVLTYLLLPEVVRGHRATPIAIDPVRFRETIGKAGRYYRMPTFEKPRNVILLATGVPVYAADKRHQSFAFFDEAVAQLKAEGYQDIWLKPHPRVEIRDIYPSSNLAAQGVRLLESDVPLVEAIVEQNRDRIDLIISLYSSFSVYSEPLFGIRSRRVEGAMIDAYQRDLKSIQDGHVQPV